MRRREWHNGPSAPIHAPRLQGGRYDSEDVVDVQAQPIPPISVCPLHTLAYKCMRGFKIKEEEEEEE